MTPPTTCRQEPEARESVQWYLYLIRNRLDQLYCGVTTDVARRFREHEASGARCARSLRGKGPLRLCCVIAAGSQRQALQLEIRVKRLTRAAKEQLIAGHPDWQTLGPSE